MRAALALCLIASPALAGASYTVTGREGDLRLTLAPCDAPCVAEVRIDNALVFGANGFARLDMGDMWVRVELAQQPERAPDTFEIQPPEGFIAIPPSIVVEDDASATVRIVRAADVPQG